MEISVMVSTLKTEINSIEKELPEKKTEANALRLKLGAVESEIQKLTDKHEALRMALDALELVRDVPAQVPSPAPTQVAVKKVEVKNIHHSRKARKIGKFDPHGKKIGEFTSITKAAKEFGWNNTSMTKYIENTGKDKQIRLRGYYLQFIAA